MGVFQNTSTDNPILDIVNTIQAKLSDSQNNTTNTPINNSSSKKLKLYILTPSLT